MIPGTGLLYTPDSLKMHAQAAINRDFQVGIYQISPSAILKKIRRPLPVSGILILRYPLPHQAGFITVSALIILSAASAPVI